MWNNIPAAVFCLLTIPRLDMSNPNEDLGQQEQLDLIESLRQTYLAENDVQYLDTAIEIVETLVPRNKHVEYTLYQLRESYKWQKSASEKPVVDEWYVNGRPVMFKWKC